MFTRIDHIALNVSNLEASIQFYSDIFGFKVYFRNTIPSGLEIVYMKLGDTVLELAAIPEALPSGFHFCIHTSDFEAAVQHLAVNNVEILQATHPTNPRVPAETGWRRAVYLGPDGEHIEIRG